MEPKSLLKSKTVWGGLIAVLPAISDVLSELAGVPGLPPSVTHVVSALGGILAIFGRFVAKVPLKP